MFIAPQFIIRLCKQHICSSSEEWIKKMWLYTVEYYLATMEDKLKAFIGRWIQYKNLMLRMGKQHSGPCSHLGTLSEAKDPHTTGNPWWGLWGLDRQYLEPCRHPGTLCETCRTRKPCLKTCPHHRTLNKVTRALQTFGNLQWGLWDLEVVLGNPLTPRNPQWNQVDG